MMTQKERNKTKSKRSPNQPAELDTLKAEVEKNLAGWQRARADLDNFKKRSAKKNRLTVARARDELFRELIPVLDNYRKALEQVAADSRAASKNNDWIKGFEYVLAQFEDLLKRHNIERMNCLGEEFNPAYHEAVECAPSGKKKNEIIREVRAGYLSHGELLLPARVIVSKGKPRPKILDRKARQ